MYGSDLIYEIWGNEHIDSEKIRKFIVGVFLRGIIYSIKLGVDFPVKHLDGLKRVYKSNNDEDYPVVIFKGDEFYKKYAVLPFPIKIRGGIFKGHHVYSFLAYGHYFSLIVSSHKKDEIISGWCHLS